MIFLVFAAILAAIVAINIFLWKSGFLWDAEKPEKVIDKPVTDARAREAVRKRLARWREEGRITRAEAEHWELLCAEEWDPAPTENGA